MDAVKEIERRLRLGKGIEPYLSKDARLGNIDKLFNDWNILHCHLDNGKSEEKHLKGLNRRTGNILMLMLIGNEAYFLDVFKHNMWTKKKLLEITYGNWKELLHIYNGELDINGTKSEKDISRARSSGIVYLVDIEPYKEHRIIVLPNGLGMTSSQHPMRLVRKKDYIYETIKNVLNKIFIEKSMAKDYSFNYKYPNLYMYLNYKDIIRVLSINIMSFHIEIGEIKKFCEKVN